MAQKAKPKSEEPPRDNTLRYAEMFAALGSEPRLRIVRLLLEAHPNGMVAGAIQEQLDAGPSTLSHHLEKLRRQGLITMTRESTFLRYRASPDALRELMTFIYSECCTKNAVVEPGEIFKAEA